MASCPICNHPDRHMIEQDLFDGVSLEDIIINYGKETAHSFTKDQLRIHSVCHIKMPSTGTEDSLANKLSLKETDMLVVACNEYMATLQRLGKVINGKLDQIERGEAETRSEFTKPMVDLYLGTGTQIRDTVKAMSETYATMHGDDVNVSRSGLSILSSALDRSREKFGSSSSSSATSSAKVG